MLKRFFIICLLVMSSAAQACECVILLHGMGRSSFSMNKIASELSDAGYQTWNKSYASTEKPIKELAHKHVTNGINYCQTQQARQIHVVTHSLGGILIRAYLQDHSVDNLGRIVMLSPPNKGSEVTDLLKDLKLYQWITGPAGQALSTEPSSVPNSLKPVDAPIGIITGNESSDPWFSPFIPGDDDGKVSVERARLKEMADFLVIEAGHTFIMRNEAAIEQTKFFLREGKFKKL